MDAITSDHTHTHTHRATNKSRRRKHKRPHGHHGSGDAIAGTFLLMLGVTRGILKLAKYILIISAISVGVFLLAKTPEMLVDAAIVNTTSTHVEAVSPAPLNQQQTTQNSPRKNDKQKPAASLVARRHDGTQNVVLAQVSETQQDNLRLPITTAIDKPSETLTPSRRNNDITAQVPVKTAPPAADSGSEGKTTEIPVTATTAQPAPNSPTPELAEANTGNLPDLTVSAYHAVLFENPAAESDNDVKLSHGTRLLELSRNGEWIKVRQPDTGETGYIHIMQVQ